MANETLVAQQIFSRLMVANIDTRRIKKAPCLFQSLFGGQAGNGGGTMYVPDSEVVEFDVVKGTRLLATPVHRGHVSRPLNKAVHVSGNFTSLARTFPLLVEQGVVTAAQLLKRVFAESPGSPLSQWERARRHAAVVFESQILAILAWQELAAAQMVKTGKMSLIYGTTSADEMIDTKRVATHTPATVTASWATAGTSILAQCDTICSLGQADAGAPFDTLLVGDDVNGYIAANTEIQALANIKAAGTSGFEMVWYGANFNPDAKYNFIRKNGAVPICKLRTKKGREIGVFRYEGMYNLNGTETPHIGAKEAIFFDVSAACDRFFGPAEKLSPTNQMILDWAEIFGFMPKNPTLPTNIDATEGVIDASEFSCDVRRNSENSAFELTTQAAPMYVTRETDKFAYIADVTAT